MRSTLAVLLLPLIAGCASSRVLSSPAPDDRPRADWNARSGGVRASVERVIVRGGPGSWVKEADWDEYVLIVDNETSGDVTVKSIELSSAMVPVARHSTSREQLEKDSANALGGLEATAIVIGSGLGAPVAAVLAAPVVGATGYAMLGLAIIAVPVALVGSGIYVYNRFNQDSADRTLVEKELERRGYNLPTRLASGGQLRASAFFSITPAPSRMTVAYDADGAERRLDIELSGLSRLHLAPESR